MGGTGNLPVPPGYQPGGREEALIRFGPHKKVEGQSPFSTTSRRYFRVRVYLRWLLLAACLLDQSALAPMLKALPVVRRQSSQWQ